MFCVHNVSQKEVLADKVEKATTLIRRMKGLLGRASLHEGAGLWIEPCNSIHTFFMKFSIDVVFISSSMEVLRILEQYPPFRMTSIIPHSRCVLELPAGTLQRRSVRVGDFVSLEEVH